MSDDSTTGAHGQQTDWFTGEEYLRSSSQWAAEQVERIEASGGTDGTLMRGMPVVVLTTIGARSSKARKVPLMRVEHEGSYAAVASLGGSPKHPVWYYNLLAHPRIGLQDATERSVVVAREVTGDEKALWWERSVAAFADYADYQAKTDREIPVFVLEPEQS